jgi:hypothetical protein
MVAPAGPHAAGGRFITAMAAVAGSVAEELIGAFAVPRIRRAYVNNGGDIALHLAPGRVVRDRPLRRSGARPRRPAARRPLRDRRRLAGARHRHLGLARPQLLARHRRRGDGARDERVARRRGRDRRRQRGRRRRSAHRPPPGERGARRQRPRRPPRHLRRAAAARRARRRRRSPRPAAPQSEIAAGRIVAALLCLQGRAAACGAPHPFLETCP